MRLADINPAGYGPGADATEILAEAVANACKKGATDKLIELSAFEDGLPLIRQYRDNSGPIQFKSGGITIRGGNRYSSGFAVDPKSYTSPTGNYSALHTNDQPWLTFERFRIDGQRTHVTLLGTVAIGNSMIYVSPGSANAELRQLVVHGVFNGVGEAFPLMLTAQDGTVDDCDIFDVIGTGVHALGSGSRVGNSRFTNCTWNSISLYNAVDPQCWGNTCRSPGKRNINLELTSGALVTANRCVGSVFGNIGTYHGVSKSYIGGNYCEGGNTANYQLGEIDIPDEDTDIELGPNCLIPRATGWHVSRSTKAQIRIADPLWGTYRIFQHA